MCRSTARIFSGKSTVISTNLSMKELQERYSERIMSRIIEHYTVLQLYGENIRYQKRKKEMIQGCLGVYVNDGSVISFQLGEGNMQDALQRNRTISVNPVALEGQVRWLTVKGYNIASRGWNNLKCQEVASDIKHNRLLSLLLCQLGRIEVEIVFAQCLFKGDVAVVRFSVAVTAIATILRL